MKRASRLGLLLVAIAAAGLLAARRWTGSTPSATAWRTATVQRGDVTQLVSATGSLSALTTVAVGSQVSGNIAKLHADYNDHIQAGQLIAEIDPTAYQARLVQAEADLLSAQATLELKQVSARRISNLLAQNLVSPSDYDEVSATLRQQEAAAKKAAAAVNSARLDVEHCRIVSPIDGVVLSRSVDAGQTVQASFSAPTLYTLAQDLRLMQITANISEADIGSVAAGQPVTFTVDAFSGRTFPGRVREVRNNSTIANNVVTYPTIVTVDNRDLQLRPGMTANVTIVTARRTAVLRVPNAALRFRIPDGAVVQPPSGLPPTPPAGAGPIGSVSTPAGAPAPASATLPAAPPSDHGTPPRLLYVVAAPTSDALARGPLIATPVRIGLADATHTEILDGVAEGAVVATGSSNASATAAAATASASTINNPFAPPKPPAGGPPPPR